VCEHGDGDDCVALHLGEPVQRTERQAGELDERLRAPRKRVGGTA
jgi:hypothetical protein